MQLSVKRLTETAKMPTKGYDSDAGLDVFADEDVIIRPGETRKISTGIACQLPDVCYTGFETWGLMVWDRSSLGGKGIHRLAGVLDFHYRGTWFINLTNLNVAPLLDILAEYSTSPDLPEIYKYALETNSYIINRGDKIAQVLIQTINKVEILEVDELKETDRGSRGFGSTGV